MKGQGTEITASKAPSVACQAELNLFQCRNTTLLLIHRMNFLRIGHCIHIIHLPLCQRQCRGILYNISLRPIRFCHWSGTERICILILNGKTVCISLLILPHFLIRRKNNRLINPRKILTFKYSSCNISKFLYRKPACQCICNLYDRMLTHPIGNHICPGINEYTVLYFIFPIIIMGQSSQAGFNPAQNNGCFFISLADQIAVHDHCAVRSKSHLTARRVRILLSVLLRHCIVIYHGIHISGRYQKSQPRFSKYLNTLLLFPVRLRNDTHFISTALQQPADNRSTKGRMVHIGITCNIGKVYLLPPPLFHFFLRYR